MIFTKSLLYKLLLITLSLCCLTTVYAGKLPKIKTNSNTTEVELTKTEVSTTTEAAKDEKPSSEEEADDDEDEDDEDDDDDETAAEKNALKPADNTSLSVWSAVKGLWNWIREDLSESLFGDDGSTAASAVGEGRTFGKIRRMQMALIPIIFKFGILSAMVAFLVALGLKTLFLVKMLFLLNAAALLGKFFTLKSNFGHVEHVAAPAPSWGWAPQVSSGWHSAPAEHVAPHPSKEIHLHIHGAQGQPQVGGYSTYGATSAGHSSSSGWERRNDPYSAYEPLPSQQTELQNELTTNNAAGGGGLQINYPSNPSNHRMF